MFQNQHLVNFYQEVRDIILSGNVRNSENARLRIRDNFTEPTEATACVRCRITRLQRSFSLLGCNTRFHIMQLGELQPVLLYYLYYLCLFRHHKEIDVSTSC